MGNTIKHFGPWAELWANLSLRASDAVHENPYFDYSHDLLNDCMLAHKLMRDVPFHLLGNPQDFLEEPPYDMLVPIYRAFRVNLDADTQDEFEALFRHLAIWSRVSVGMKVGLGEAWNQLFYDWTENGKSSLFEIEDPPDEVPFLADNLIALFNASESLPLSELGSPPLERYSNHAFGEDCISFLIEATDTGVYLTPRHISGLLKVHSFLGRWAHESLDTKSAALAASNYHFMLSGGMGWQEGNGSEDEIEDAEP